MAKDSSTCLIWRHRMTAQHLLPRKPLNRFQLILANAVDESWTFPGFPIIDTSRNRNGQFRLFVLQS